MSFIDEFNSDDEVDADTSEENRRDLEKKYFQDDNHPNEIVEAKSPSMIMRFGKKIESVVLGSSRLGNKMFKKNINKSSYKQTSFKNKNPYRKFINIRDKQTGKIIGRKINLRWIKFENPNYSYDDFDRAGRMRGGISGSRRNRAGFITNTRFKKSAGNIISSLIPINDNLQQMQNKKNIAMQRRNIAMGQMSNITNKFNQRLIEEKNHYQQIQARRNYNTCPQSWAKERLAIKKQHIENTREHSRETNILNSHRLMLTPKENQIVDIFDNSVLRPLPGNSIMEQRPDSLNLLSTKGKATILSGENNLKF